MVATTTGCVCTGFSATLLGYAIIVAGVLAFAEPAVSRLNSLTFGPRYRSNWLELDLEEARKRAETEPEKAKPAWDLGRIKLELYFDRNLSQIKYIFMLSVGVMVVGFAFVLAGIFLAFNPVVSTGVVAADRATVPTQATAVTPAVIGGVAGIITEFIGTTFLFIYRSTIQQAASYTRTLERINSVGMAMQILDTISEGSSELKDKTRAEIVKLLLSPSGVSAELGGAAEVDETFASKLSHGRRGSPTGARPPSPRGEDPNGR
jgi:hypothetical protein